MKRIILSIIVISLSFSLFGCSNKNKQNDTLSPNLQSKESEEELFIQKTQNYIDINETLLEYQTITNENVETEKSKQIYDKVNEYSNKKVSFTFDLYDININTLSNEVVATFDKTEAIELYEMYKKDKVLTIEEQQIYDKKYDMIKKKNSSHFMITKFPKIDKEYYLKENERLKLYGEFRPMNSFDLINYSISDYFITFMLNYNRVMNNFIFKVDYIDIIEK